MSLPLAYFGVGSLRCLHNRTDATRKQGRVAGYVELYVTGHQHHSAECTRGASRSISRQESKVFSVLRRG